MAIDIPPYFPLPLLEQYALTEASYLIVRLLQRFSKIESVLPREQALSKAVALTLVPAKGARVRLYRDA